MEEMYKSLPKVAQVIDDFTFVINRGTQDGIEVNQNYLIFYLGERIIDPDSGDDLGPLEIVRGRARVKHVQERLATLESADTIIVPGRVKRIKRQSSSILFALGSGPSEEEVEEGRESRKAKIDASVGDFVRRM